MKRNIALKIIGTAMTIAITTGCVSTGSQTGDGALIGQQVEHY